MPLFDENGGVRDAYIKTHTTKSIADALRDQYPKLKPDTAFHMAADLRRWCYSCRGQSDITHGAHE